MRKITAVTILSIGTREKIHDDFYKNFILYLIKLRHLYIIKYFLNPPFSLISLPNAPWCYLPTNLANYHVDKVHPKIDGEQKISGSFSPGGNESTRTLIYNYQVK